MLSGDRLLAFDDDSASVLARADGHLLQRYTFPASKEKGPTITRITALASGAEISQLSAPQLGALKAPSCFHLPEMLEKPESTPFSDELLVPIDSTHDQPQGPDVDVYGVFP